MKHVTNKFIMQILLLKKLQQLKGSYFNPGTKTTFDSRHAENYV